MIETHGLSHLALAVRDPERSLHFYREAFGAVEYYRDATTIQVQGPGRFVVLAFEKMPEEAGKAGGILHFGFRLKCANDVDQAVQEAEKAGGKLLRRGEFSPGYPFAYLADPDGYEIEVWFE